MGGGSRDRKQGSTTWWLRYSTADPTISGLTRTVGTAPFTVIVSDCVDLSETGLKSPLAPIASWAPSTKGVIPQSVANVNVAKIHVAHRAGAILDTMGSCVRHPLPCTGHAAHRKRKQTRPRYNVLARAQHSTVKFRKVLVSQSPTDHRPSVCVHLLASRRR
jgi:hypothetical protein